ncbi:hypothetical protein LCGC14_0913710 [marine sediment metagenome]|uniref:Uncharacterized protein n=1 Tax=marine sediment metagenome TaxID=412755 RepID=A0A0F9RZI4_9ZZZZ
MQHRNQTDLEQANFTSTVKAMKTPEGYILAAGATVPADASTGYAPGCLFIHTDGSALGVFYVNDGTKASSNFNTFMSVDGAVMADPSAFAFGTLVGTKFGSATNQKIGFWNKTPVVQPSGADQDALATTSATQSSPWGFASQAQADDIAATVNAIRTALVNCGIIKGSA